MYSLVLLKYSSTFSKNSTNYKNYRFKMSNNYSSCSYIKRIRLKCVKTLKTPNLPKSLLVLIHFYRRNFISFNSLTVF